MATPEPEQPDPAEERNLQELAYRLLDDGYLQADDLFRAPAKEEPSGLRGLVKRVTDRLRRRGES